MSEFLDKKQQEKILTPRVKRIMRVLEEAGEIRVVGGAVRDALLNRNIGDIDFATTLPPEQVMELLRRQDIKTVPTGLAHGTVTAVLDHVGHEITTLRLDHETDGRHARVTYTDDWRRDASRRDFTFNALYLDAKGILYDFFGGVDDAQKGHVRFIGDASSRIREDVLRILRFFRFYAFFGRGTPDTEALNACRDLANLIPHLSTERVMREVIKLLSAPDPWQAWRWMSECGVTRSFLPEADNLEALQNLLQQERLYKEGPAALTRLVALLPSDKQLAISVATRLKFSNRDSERLCALISCVRALENISDAAALRRVIYDYGVENTRGALFLERKNISQSLDVMAAWENPVFPIKGEDIIKTGLHEGPQVGEVLRKVEAWWRAGDFRATRADCLLYAQACAQATKS